MSDMKTHWAGFLNAMGKTPNPTSTNTLPFENTSTKIGVSGFLDLKSSKSEFQARYDAMSGSCEGVDASDKAVLKSKSDRTQFMPIDSKASR
jgi:hypothetical protein